ncbi:MAG: glutamine synthetase [Nocardioidaceae bacterium]
MDAADREARKTQAEALLEGLASAGVVAVATTYVDNAGITRVKAVPLNRLPQMAAWGVGFSPSFDRFRFDDWIAASGTGAEPVGDLRLIPDTRRLIPLAAQPGWAWAPADRYQQSGQPHPQDSRLLLQRMVDDLSHHGLAVKSSFEIEWVVSEGSGDEFTPAVSGAGYGMARLIGLSDYGRELITALGRQDVAIEQFHPEYAAGQMEVSVAPESPLDAADTSVLVRATIKAVGEKHGLRTSFSPKVDVAGVGNGGHVHLSVWRDRNNLMSGGDGRVGMTADGEAFAAGVLSRLPALLAIGCPSPVSYLRLVPSHWAGDYACWGLENREAAVRMVTGSTGSSTWAANMEVKCFDLLANPYLLMAGLLAAGMAGLANRATLPDPIDVDPAVLGDKALVDLGIERLPTSLDKSVAALVADQALTEALGPELLTSLVAIRESEIELFADASPAEIAAATRWLH